MIRPGSERDLKALWAALFEFQGMAHGVVKDARNPHFKNTYASLEAVIDTARPLLQKCGLVFTQSPGIIMNGNLRVETIIAHPKSGESISYEMEIPLAKQDPQGAGSAITYACRYSLMAILGLPPLDDDGNHASATGNGSPAVAAPVGRSPSAGAANQSQQTKELLIKTLRLSKTTDELFEWFQLESTRAALSRLTEADKQLVRDEYSMRQKALKAAETVGAG